MWNLLVLIVVEIEQFQADQLLNEQVRGLGY